MGGDGVPMAQRFAMLAGWAMWLIRGFSLSVEVVLHQWFGARYFSVPGIVGIFFGIQCVASSLVGNWSSPLLSLYSWVFLALALWHKAEAWRHMGEVYSYTRGLSWPLWDRLSIRPDLIQRFGEPALVFAVGLALGYSEWLTWALYRVPDMLITWCAFTFLGSQADSVVLWSIATLGRPPRIDTKLAYWFQASAVALLVLGHIGYRNTRAGVLDTLDAIRDAEYMQPFMQGGAPQPEDEDGYRVRRPRRRRE